MADVLTSWIPWLGVAVVFAGLLITYVRLHEDPARLERRRWRNVVLGLGVVGGLAGALTAFNGGALRRTVILLENLAHSQASSLAELQNRLDVANIELKRQRRALKDAHSSIDSADASISQVRADAFRVAARLRTEQSDQKKALDVAIGAIAIARRQIAQTRAATGAVASESRRALKESAVGNARARRIAALVAQAEEDTSRRLDEAKAIADQAATKAGVYHVGEATLERLGAQLRSGYRGTASIACAPGLENACKDIGSAFQGARWRTQVVLGASFFTGGGLDAESDSKPDAGLIIWHRPVHKQLARSIADILSSESFAIDVREARDVGTAERDISIAIRFLSR